MRDTSNRRTRRNDKGDYSHNPIARFIVCSPAGEQASASETRGIASGTVSTSRRSQDERRPPERSVIVHGDLHDTNALSSGGGFKLVDPDGLLAEAEYDLGITMREDPLELFHGDPFDRARSLASLTGLDPTAIWEWGVVERVSTCLYAS